MQPLDGHKPVKMQSEENRSKQESPGGVTGLHTSDMVVRLPDVADRVCEE